MEIKKLIKKIERKTINIYDDIISEQAYENIDEDWKTKEEIMEEHFELISEIENADPDWDRENRIWENWYARGYEVALKDLLFKLKENGN